MQFAAQLILARLLFPSDFGILAMAYPIIGFIHVFSDIGVAQSVVQKQIIAQRDLAEHGAGLSLAAIIMIAAPLAVGLYDNPRIVPVLQVLTVMLVVASLQSIPNALLARQMWFGKLAAVELVPTLLGVIVSIALAEQRCSYWSLMFGAAVSSLAALAGTGSPALSSRRGLHGTMG